MRNIFRNEGTITRRHPWTRIYQGGGPDGVSVGGRGDGVEESSDRGSEKQQKTKNLPLTLFSISLSPNRRRGFNTLVNTEYPL